MKKNKRRGKKNNLKGMGRINYRDVTRATSDIDVVSGHVEKSGPRESNLLKPQD